MFNSNSPSVLLPLDTPPSAYFATPSSVDGNGEDNNDHKPPFSGSDDPEPRTTNKEKALTESDTDCQSNFQKLNSFTRVPDYTAYLAHILTEIPQEEERIRTIAGYLLKNNARLVLTSSPDVAQYVKAAVLRAFDDGSVMIRNVAGQDIVSFLGVLEPRNWPECLSQLVNKLDLSDLDKQEVSKSITSL